jgi:hypothetical protein
VAATTSGDTTTASGSCEVPQPRPDVWRALAVLEPYCAVCDVSYVLGESGRGPDIGTTFVCAAGRLDGAEPAVGAPRGEIVAWEPEQLVGTRLELTPETWTTRIELTDAGSAATRVTITVTHEPRGGNRLLHRLVRSGVRQMVQRTVDGELDKLPAHVDLLSRD